MKFKLQRGRASMRPNMMVGSAIVQSVTQQVVVKAALARVVALFWSTVWVIIIQRKCEMLKVSEGIESQGAGSIGLVLKLTSKPTHEKRNRNSTRNKWILTVMEMCPWDVHWSQTKRTNCKIDEQGMKLNAETTGMRGKQGLVDQVGLCWRKGTDVNKSVGSGCEYEVGWRTP